ncbi:MAG TPA: acyltransferase [Candidatus Deferrimicrobium sp.]|nr:acyltransferase [Candidatus Deferrimicrobium sp.]
MLNMIIKRFLFLVGLVVTSPLILLTLLEGWIVPQRWAPIFGSCREMLAIWPTPLGEYMRLAYYWAICTDVSPNATFLFGSMLARRRSIIRSGVVIGAFSLLGYVDIGENVLFGARVSVLSGKYQHGRPGERHGSELTEGEFQVIKIGRNSWIGQDAVIMANIGENCTVGAGSVVYKDVEDNTTVMGNPARKVNL